MKNKKETIASLDQKTTLKALEGKSQHTPTPWKSDGSYIIGSNNLSVAKATIYKGTNEVKDIENEEKAEANAAFIVRAVNAHEELLSCLKEIYEWTDYKNTDWAKRSAQAIAKAEEKTK